MLEFQEKSRQISREHYRALCTYIENHFVEEPFACAMPQAAPPASGSAQRSERATAKKAARVFSQSLPAEQESCSADLPEETEAAGASLEDYLSRVKDESFSQMLLRKIDEKGIRDADCYKKAHIDKRLFSKIRSNPSYKPSKQTALALIVALELPYAEAVEMLHKAGYALSRASKADLIVEYYLQQGIYDIFVINNSLYDFDQPLICSI